MISRMFAIVLILCGTLFLVSCASLDSGNRIDPFAGSYQGNGSDSEGNDYVFAAKVSSLGEGKYQMLVLDKIDTQKKPMHIMDGVLEDNKFIYTSDGGIYAGECEIGDGVVTGYYKGPVDGSFKMTRLKSPTP